VSDFKSEIRNNQIKYENSLNHFKDQNWIARFFKPNFKTFLINHFISKNEEETNEEYEKVDSIDKGIVRMIKKFTQI